MVLSAAGLLRIGADRLPIEARLESGGSASELKFVIAPASSRDARDDPIQALPDQFGPDDARLLAAAQWAVELDYAAEARLKGGRTVEKLIPADPPRALPRPLREGTGDDYWAARRPIGTLLRPLLLRPSEVDGLFPYQRAGVAWLCDHRAGILADDMGLGKTVQVIAAIQQLVGSGSIRTALVVAPRSMLATWESELARWAPTLACLRITPSAAAREEAWSAVLGRMHVLLTNYEQLRDPPASLAGFEVPLLVADEAHRIRNVEAQITQGMRELKVGRFWALTGTPIERDARDLITLLSLLAPSRFALDDARDPPEVVRARARPFLLRRTKQEVLEELPDVLNRREVLELLPPQRRSYERALARVNRTRGGYDDTLEVLNELRTICDYDPMTGASAKVERICELLEEIQLAGEKAVVFSTLIRPLELLLEQLERHVEAVGARLLIGELSLPERERTINEFREETSVVALLASTRVAGEGLTLTEANHVVFVNEWWNPSANAQARDRVVRIGQRRGVYVYQFRCKDTVEETLDAILKRKERLFDNVVERLASPEAARDPEAEQLIDELLSEQVSSQAAP